jgi:hypothetical protein
MTEELHRQIKRVVVLHGKGLAEGYDGVFLDDVAEKKYPKAAKEPGRNSVRLFGLNISMRACPQGSPRSSPAL